MQEGECVFLWFTQRALFSEAFNSVVETYAVATYGEVNPAVFTIVTFPFLFGLMFGDVGHGLMLLFVALAIIAFEGRLGRMSKARNKKKKKKDPEKKSMTNHRFAG